MIQRIAEHHVLGVHQSGGDGFEVLRRLRSRQSQTNVLVLTARDAVEDRVHGLDLGADDYLTKPFSITEFEARVRALLRRTLLPAGAVSIGQLKVDVEAKSIRCGEAAIDLTAREWAFAHGHDAAISMDKLLNGEDLQQRPAPG